MNLKDKGNPGLRDAVVRGEVKATELSTMSKEVSLEGFDLCHPVRPTADLLPVCTFLQDMASQSLQALRKKLETENLFNSRGAEQIAVRPCLPFFLPQPHDHALTRDFPSFQAETDQFKCGKCGHKRTTYYQMQTRSADEPMTVRLLSSLHLESSDPRPDMLAFPYALRLS